MPRFLACQSGRRQRRTRTPAAPPPYALVPSSTPLLHAQPCRDTPTSPLLLLPPVQPPSWRQPHRSLDASACNANTPSLPPTLPPITGASAAPVRLASSPPLPPLGPPPLRAAGLEDALKICINGYTSGVVLQPNQKICLPPFYEACRFVCTAGRPCPDLEGGRSLGACWVVACWRLPAGRLLAGAGTWLLVGCLLFPQGGGRRCSPACAVLLAPRSPPLEAIS